MDPEKWRGLGGETESVPSSRQEKRRGFLQLENLGHGQRTDTGGRSTVQ